MNTPTTKHSAEFVTLVKNVKRILSTQSIEGMPYRDQVVIKAARKTVCDRDIMRAGKMMFEEHMPVRVGVRYMFGLLLKMLNIQRKDIVE